MNNRDYIGIFGFFLLGVLISGLACIVAVFREYAQYESSGVLEHEDLQRYVVWSGVGALVQVILILILK